MAKRILVFVIVLFSFAFTPFQTSVSQKAEIVFCVDLSASTNGLLNDIRDNLWYFISDVRKNMPETDLRIGIVGFARPSFGAGNYYVKVLCDLSENYDLVSYTLFQLKVNIEKGDQCDGSALFTAMTGIDWNKNPQTKKLIYLFGNGSVNMCGYNYQKVCELAINKNIHVNAVYCVQREMNRKELRGWNEIAAATGGEFYTFQITKRTPLLKFSADAQWLVDLNKQLHDTYIYFGKNGKERYDMMCAGDDNSKRMNEDFFYSRCRYKLSKHYEEQCRQWDLVSLIKTDLPDFTKLSKDYLPKDFQIMNPKDLKEEAISRKNKREIILTQMEKGLVQMKTDTVFANPMDSIFSGGISKF
jgi:hypothetical protein